MEKVAEEKCVQSWPRPRPNPLNLLWRLIQSVCIPITLPWLIYNLIHRIKLMQVKGKLQGKVVLITGASSGLGKSLAHAFYSAGCKVILASRRKEELEAVRDSLISSHVTTSTHPPVVLPLDLSDLNSIPTQVAKVLTIFGHVDILVNNGGVSYRGQVVSTGVNVDIEVMLVNYFGQVALTKALLPSMIERQSGSIVAVSSVQGRVAIPYRSAYTASKHALQAFCDTLRAEVARHNIDVCVISPGYIRTNLSLNALTGNGQTYGVLDKTTSSGYPPEQVADEIVRAVMLQKKEVIFSPILPRLAIIIRTLAPSLYFWIMKKRAHSQANTQHED